MFVQHNGYGLQSAQGLPFMPAGDSSAHPIAGFQYTRSADCPAPVARESRYGR